MCTYPPNSQLEWLHRDPTARIRQSQGTTLRSVSQNGWIRDGSWPANACRLEQIGRRMHPWLGNRFCFFRFLGFAEIYVKQCSLPICRAKRCHVGFGCSLIMTDRNRLQPVVHAALESTTTSWAEVAVTTKGLANTKPAGGFNQSLKNSQFGSSS